MIDARRLLRHLAWAGGSLVMALLLAALALALSGLDDREAQADLIVVPGNTVHPDGQPSARLQARLDAALHLYRQQRAPRILVSGAVGVEGQDEATVMARYLVQHGVPTQAVIEDHAGVDTAATARNTATYLQAHGLRSVLVASQYFHIPRTCLALARQGVEVRGSRHARYVEWRDLYSTLREVVGYLAYSLR